MEQKLEMPLNDTLLVGFDFTHGEDEEILIVGRKDGDTLEVVNAFQGGNARALYELLTTKP